MQILPFGPTPILMALLLFIIILLCLEGGFRFGRIQRTLESNPGFIQGAILTLAGLMLGFMFNFAQQRYEIRREAGVSEANAISTAYLYTNYSKEPEAAKMRRLIAHYLKLRIDFYEANSRQSERSVLEESYDTEEQLWHEVNFARIIDPVNPHKLLLASSITGVFDRAQEQNETFSYNVPYQIILLPFIVAGISGFILGYDIGKQGRRMHLHAFLFALMVSLLVYLDLDLAQARKGFIRANSDPLIHVNLTCRTCETAKHQTADGNPRRSDPYGGNQSVRRYR